MVLHDLENQAELMKPRDLALAVAVAAIWGVNFVVIDVGLAHFPPLLFSALRFAVAAFPAVLFAGPPPTRTGTGGPTRPGTGRQAGTSTGGPASAGSTGTLRWRWVIAVALALGVTKFSLLFAGMAAGMPAGLSSLVLQSQAIFTMAFAAALLGERPARAQIGGLAIAAAGIAIVATRVGAGLPPTAFVLVIGAAVAWGVSNVATRKAAPADMLRFMVWVSVVAALPLAVLSLLFEGPARDLAALRATDLEAVGALLFVALVSTLAGFGAWGFLIRRYGATTVAPFSLLVPVFGIGSAALLLGENVHVTDLVGGALVVGGVLLPTVRRRWLGLRHDGGGTGDPLSRRGRGARGQGRELRRPA
jgi:O-acetylserine/cysteine efflux transporter